MMNTTVGHESIGKKGGSSILEVLRVLDFRLLWIGEGISLMGDQFHLIALAWLVLQLTGDAFALGTVLAVAGVPRALFILVGGALTDRMSPRRLMLGSNILRMLLVALMSVLVLAGLAELWMLYLFALSFGLADAFFFPAQQAIVPQLVSKEQLQTANSIVGGTAQLSLLAGPMVAGVLIAFLAGDISQATETAEGIPDSQGIGLAFGLDAFTFLISAITLWMMKVNKSQPKPSERCNILSSIRAGLVSVWNDETLRAIFFILAAINILVNGPILVGIPVLADSRFPEGAAALGIVMSAFGGGALLGTVLAGVLPKPAPQRMGSILMIVITPLGIGLVLLGFTSLTAVAAPVILGMGMVNGYFNVLFITWLQSRTAPVMLGRMMSLVMFAALGLQPVSTALAGAMSALNTTALFVGAGSLMSVITLLSALNPAVRAMDVKQVETIC